MKTKLEGKSKFSRYINIGGCPYHRKALLNGFAIFIMAATDDKLSIHNMYGKQEWIEMDNDQLKMTEKFQKALY